MQNKKLNVLIVEDEILLGMELANYVEELGYHVVDYVTNMQSTKKIMQKNTIDIILMDINLNDKMDGITLYKSLNTDALVIYITAYKDDDTLSKMIETTPLGYLVKPYKEEELKALLLLAQYQLQKKHKQQKIDLGNEYYFNRYENQLFHKDEHIDLSTKELKLLKMLLDADGEVVSFQKIEDEIYENNIISDSTLRTLIYRLRNKLGHHFIYNEFKYGIRLKIK